jgi:hypothetical protein
LLWAAVVAAMCISSHASAQAPNASLPESIYWRQNLFSIPYQWNSVASLDGTQTVWLYVSKDRGASWQQIGDAQPQLLAFNYRAEADGEYWFAIRTTDASGRDTRSARVPASSGTLQPELRVIVDTTMPRFDGLIGVVRDPETLEVRWRVVDANLSAHSCNVEVQVDGASGWQPMSLTGSSEVSPGVWDAMATVPITPGTRPVAVRATVFDLAGNRAVYHSAVTAAGDASPSQANAVASPGWVSNSAPTAPNNWHSQPAVSQPWPADRAASSEPGLTSEPAVTYGTPSPASEEDVVGIPTPETEDRPLGNIPPPPHSLPFTPLEPFRQVSVSREILSADATTPVADAVGPSDAVATSLLVNSRTFQLEYDLAEIGPEGVAKVELWGTRDGGQSWQNYAVDDDNRSPLVVTVDGEGQYGFSIVVQGAGGVGGFPPQPGDRPELLVGVDLQRPDVRLTSVDGGTGAAAGRLVLRWEAIDDNLEPRPIALFYSSRARGPWTAIATSLENVGKFTWPVERHVPRHVYLRLEARDAAGNVAAFQTSEPVTVESDPSVARVD